MEFFKRVPQVEPFKELAEQKDNKFTFLELLDPTCVEAAVATQNYIFTLSSGSFELKCWSLRSSKLQNSARLGPEYTPKSSDKFQLLVNRFILVLLASGNNGSTIFLWDFKRRDVMTLDEPIIYKSKVIQSKIDSGMLYTYAADNEMAFWSLKDGEITLCGSKKKSITFMEPLDGNDRALYLAHSQTLSIVIDFTNICWRDQNAAQKILALHIVKMKSKSMIITGHKNHVIRIWNSNITPINEVDLLKGTPDAPKPQTSTLCSYRIHYLEERDELIIAHNENISVYKMISRSSLHLEQQAHRTEITEVTSYKGEPSYLLTKCQSSIRLWRYTMTSDPALNLVGEISVTNVDKVVPVSDVGLYLVGKCYHAGLVLWRYADSYLSRQLKASRNFYVSN
ncbi:hypothetical protein ACHWQZ_G016783 [Mnemiopsis leidyi]